MPKDNVFKLWDQTLKHLYTEEYTNSLIELLKENQVKTVLDCGRGVGFPAIDLARAGFGVDCVDESHEAINKLEENLYKSGVDLNYHLLSWGSLHKTGKKFDAIVCQGNTIAYLGTWHQKVTIENQLNKMIVCLQSMYEVLNPGGIMFVDITSQNEYDRGPVFEMEIPSSDPKINWIVEHDWKNRQRIVRSRRELEGELHTFNYYSFILEHEELKVLLRGVGFSTIQKIVVPGENLYEVFLVRK